MKVRYLMPIFFLLINICYGQQKWIKGKVVTFKEYPLNKVKIKASKSKNIVYTDSLGNFKILCESKDYLYLKADGFFDDKIKIEKGVKEDLVVNLYYDETSKRSFKRATKSLHVTKKILDYALAYKRAQNNVLETLTSIYDIIQYQYPAAKLADVEGTTQILLNARGENSIFADIHALLVLDGRVVNDISGITPMEVKEVRILQGNEAAHWGMRGGNGVIEIDLKYGP